MAIKCEFHEDHVVRITELETGVKNMDTRLVKVEEKVFSPAIWVAVIALIGTITATVGGVISTILIIVAKSHGWG